jgi:hypothetical protein
METNNNGQVSAFVWTINATKMFLDQYKKHRKRVGRLEMKSLKQIWQWIAQQLSRDLGVTVQASHLKIGGRFWKGTIRSMLTINIRQGEAEGQLISSKKWRKFRVRRGPFIPTFC